MNEPHHFGSSLPPAGVLDSHGVGLLDEATCLRLLAEQHVGRLGFSFRGLPVIHPVNYLLVDRSILMRSEPGAKVDAAQVGAVACLEIDHVDGFAHEGWNVLATGRLGLATLDADALRVLPLVPWGLEHADHVLELPIDLLSGRLVSRRLRIAVDGTSAQPGGQSPT